MKIGKTLGELSTEIKRRHESKRDVIAPTSRIAFAPTLVPGDDPTKIGPVQMVGRVAEALAAQGLELKDGGVPINETAHDQLGLFLNIPAKFYDNVRTNYPDLHAVILNRLMGAQPPGTKRLLRTLDGRLRASLSDSFRILDNFDFAEAVLPAISDAGMLILSCDITDTRLYIKAVDERILRDVPAGKRLGEGHDRIDTCSPAVCFTNSEVGLGSLQIETGIYKRGCTNLMFGYAEGTVRRRHVGSRYDLEGDDVAAFLTDETRAAADKALWLKIRDVAKAALSEVRFNAMIDKFVGTAEQKFEAAADDVIEVVAKKMGFTDSERGSVLNHLIEDGDLSRYGLINAVTRTAQDLASYDRASEFEQIGGKILDLPANDWKAIAKAA